jgi:hypothetical protein
MVAMSGAGRGGDLLSSHVSDRAVCGPRPRGPPILAVLRDRGRRGRSLASSGEDGETSVTRQRVTRGRRRRQRKQEDKTGDLVDSGVADSEEAAGVTSRNEWKEGVIQREFDR